jgi:ATP-dependent Clp protease protease subunit
VTFPILLFREQLLLIGDEMTAVQKEIYVQLCDPIIEQTVKPLIDFILKEVAKGAKHFVLLISSPGGSVFWGLTAYNFLKGVPAQINTHNIGSVDSIAGVIFCAGQKRYSVPHGRFMLHGVGFDVPQGARFDEKSLDEKMKGLRMDTENIVGVIAANTGKTEDEIRKALYDGTVLNPEQAVAFGLVHEIKSELFPSGAIVTQIKLPFQNAPNLPRNF